MAAYSCPKLAELEGVYIAIATGDATMADGDAVRAALAHAETCPACAAELAAYRQLHQRLTPPRLPDDAAARIAASARAAAHIRIRAWERRRRLIRWAGVAAALVAIVAIAVGIAALLSSDRNQGAPGGTVVYHPAPPPTPTTTVPPSPPTVPASDSSAEPTPPEPKELPVFATETWQAADRFYALCEQVEKLSKQQGKADEALRKGAEAIELAESLLAKHPDFPEAIELRRQLVLCYDMTADEDGRQHALDAYLAEAEKHGGSEAWVLAIVGEAARYGRAQQGLRAVQCYDRLLARFPKGRSAAIAHRGIAPYVPYEQREQQYRLALSEGDWEVRSRLSINTELIMMNINRSRCRVALEDIDRMAEEAKTEHERAIAESLRGLALVQMGKDARALAHLRTVVQDYAPEHTSLARTQLRQLESRLLGQAVLEPVVP